MKPQTLAASLSAALIMLLLTIISTAAGSNRLFPPVNNSAAFQTNCFPASGVVGQSHFKMQPKDAVIVSTESPARQEIVTPRRYQ